MADEVDRLDPDLHRRVVEQTLGGDQIRVLTGALQRPKRAGPNARGRMRQ